MSLPPIEYDSNLARAWTIPARWYTDPEMLERERGKIFRRTWQFASALDSVPLSGSYLALEVAGVPVVIVRDAEGVLRAFYNVCRHRAGVVAREAGNRKTLQCAYHGWVYGLDGRLLNAPEFDGVESFDKAEFGLRPIRVETWGGFAFVNMDSSALSLLETLGKIPEETAEFDFERLRRVERRAYTVRANWKVYIDNYLEGYHIPAAHPGLFREIDYQNYRVDTYRYYSSQHAPIRPMRAEDPSGRVYTELRGDRRAFYYWVFPNFMLNIYPGNIQINIIVPLAHDRTLALFEWYYLEPGTPESWSALQDSIAFSDQIQKEDIELCEDVWRNLQSGAYERGRFSVRRENGVHHFQGLLVEFLQS